MAVTVITIPLEGPSFGQYEVGTNNGSSPPPPPRPHPLPPTQLPFFAPVHRFKWVFFFFFLLVLILLRFWCVRVWIRCWFVWSWAEYPVAAKAPLAFCGYANGSSSCCNATDDAAIASRFKSSNISDSACANVVKSILCAVLVLEPSQLCFAVPANCSMKCRFGVSSVINACVWSLVVIAFVSTKKGCFLNPLVRVHFAGSVVSRECFVFRMRNGTIVVMPGFTGHDKSLRSCDARCLLTENLEWI